MIPEKRMGEMMGEIDAEFKHARENPEIVPFDQRGHRVWNDQVDLSLYRLLNRPYPGEEHVRHRSLKSALSIYHDCGYCGEKIDIEFGPDEKSVVSTTECPAKEGVKNVFTLAVPSGKIIVDDDLRRWYDVPDEIERTLPDYNGHLGQAAVSQEMAKLGCAYGAVGNSCPGLYKQDEDNYVIASPGYDWEEDETIGEDTLGTCVANICTDLWAYSIADYEDWKSKGGTQDFEDGWTVTVVDVTPGIYEFTHHTGERGFDRDADGPIVYATIRRIV